MSQIEILNNNFESFSTKSDYIISTEQDDDDYYNQQNEQQKQQEDEIPSLKVPEPIINESLNVLNWEQIKKLDNLLNYTMPVHGRGNFPTLNVCLKDFIRNLNRKLLNSNVSVKDIRINGGVASYILTSMTDYQYSDIDIIFYCTLIDEKTNNFDKIKQCVFDCLLDYLPSQAKKDKISPIHLKEAYVMKMVKVFDNDVWSLISLCNNDGQNIDLKFVDKMKRQFQFSVDSFQIHLSSLLNYYDYQSSTTSTITNGTCDMNQNFYPKVNAESLYGNFNQAKYHLDNKLIATKSPEEIRGGGLLKYCNLIVRGYAAADEYLMKHHEKYMCSRFFIDFNDIEAQKYMLITYLQSHFKADFYLRYSYLIKLFEIVSKSTVCLMNHERRLTLELISQLADSYQTQIVWQQQPQIQYFYPRKNRYSSSSSSSASSTSSNSSTTSSSHHTNKKRNYNNNYRQYNRNYNNNNNNNYNQQHVYFNNEFNNQAYYSHQNNTIPQTFTISNSFLINNNNEFELAGGLATPIIITGPINDNNVGVVDGLLSTNSSSLVSSPSQSPSPSTVLSVSPALSPVPTEQQQQVVNNNQCINNNDIYYFSNNCGNCSVCSN
jgi:hypothetical protein